MPAEWPMNEYQARDAELIDYQLYVVPGLSIHPHGGVFRGPMVRGARYIACVGAAQTFGRFAHQPFSTLLSDQLGLEVMNLGSGGAGPTFFTSSDALLSYINDAQLAIVQVLSARSVSNSLFRIKFHGAWGTRLADGVDMSSTDFFSNLLQERPDAVRDVVEETRANYVAAMSSLLNAISVPTVLLWFSTRRPDYREEYRLPVEKLFGPFPQLVNGEMIRALAGQADAYVECVSSIGLPQQLLGRNGRKARVATRVSPEKTVYTSENSYYPSPEMHRDATRVLVPACLKLLHRSSAPTSGGAAETLMVSPRRPPDSPLGLGMRNAIRRGQANAHFLEKADMMLDQTLPMSRPARIPPPEWTGGASSAAVRIQPFRVQSGPIRLQWHGVARHHRSGWRYALSSIADLDSANGILFDAAVEKTFSWSKRSHGAAPVYREPWVGIVHNPPQVPDWFNYNQQSPDSILATSEWRASIGFCRGLFTLSAYLRDWLASRVEVPVENLLHPTGEPRQLFDSIAFLENPSKKLVQIGWWLRRFHSLYLFPHTRYERVLLDLHEPWTIQAMATELDFVPPARRAIVRRMPYLKATEYDSLLTRNVVFLDLYDSSANNALIECIIRGTPVLVNPLQAVREYLGDGYPLYFDSLPEAADKLADDRVVLQAHEYLLQLPTRARLTGHFFRESLLASKIVSRLASSPARLPDIGRSGP